MSWPYCLLVAWLALAIVGGLMLYIGFGFVMSAKRADDDKLSLPNVVKVDSVLAIFCVLLDGVYNAFVAPVLCLDLRPWMAFRMITFKGVTFPFFELTTERLSRYNENAKEWFVGRWWSAKLAPFLDPKDPKGWHIRKQGGNDE